MSVYELLEDVNEMAETTIAEMTEVKAEVLGLDPRAAYHLYTSNEAIAVSKNDDRTLQYYGGFEYVDKEYRQEAGDYVFYLADDERVQGHIDRWLEQD